MVSIDLTDEEFFLIVRMRNQKTRSTWGELFSDQALVYCRFCNKDFDLSNFNDESMAHLSCWLVECIEARSLKQLECECLSCNMKTPFCCEQCDSMEDED